MTGVVTRLRPGFPRNKDDRHSRTRAITQGWLTGLLNIPMS